MNHQRLFEGRLIRLTGPRPDDALTLARWSEDGEYRRLQDTDAPRPHPQEFFGDRDQGPEEPQNDAYEFRIRQPGDDRLLGFVAVVNIEWPNRNGWLSMGIGEEQDRRRGFGAEAAQLALRFAFDELGLHRLTLDVISDNLAALGLYRKLGFKEEGRLRERVWRDGEFNDLIYMGLLRAEWPSVLGAGPEGA
ncbi:MAG: GNAT family N-acetyltransferase [Candidatus Dormibacteria bacterium]